MSIPLLFIQGNLIPRREPWSQTKEKSVTFKLNFQAGLEKVKMFHFIMPPFYKKRSLSVSCLQHWIHVYITIALKCFSLLS